MDSGYTFACALWDDGSIGWGASTIRRPETLQGVPLAMTMAAECDPMQHRMLGDDSFGQPTPPRHIGLNLPRITLAMMM